MLSERFVPVERDWSFRNYQLLQLSNAGLNNSEIARRYGLSSERVRQILLREREHLRSVRVLEHVQRLDDLREALGLPAGTPDSSIYNQNSCLPILQRMAVHAWFELHGGAEAFATLDSQNL